MAGYFDTPAIMLSGDQAAANELREIVPDAELAVGKEGIGHFVNHVAPGVTGKRYAFSGWMKKIPRGGTRSVFTRRKA